MKTVILDLDGTLADTSADLISAANTCFRGLGLGDVLDPVADAETAFRGGRAMLTLGFERTGSHGAEEVERQYPQLLTAYGEGICVETRLYPGAMEAVATLRQQGYGVGICTNKPEDLAEKLLGALGVRSEFGALVGADTLPQRKPDPRPFAETVARLGGAAGRSCLVGDTVTDRETAAAAGVPAILVTFGPSGDRVEALGPEAVIGHFDELPDVVAALVT